MRCRTVEGDWELVKKRGEGGREGGGAGRERRGVRTGIKHFVFAMSKLTMGGEGEKRGRRRWRARER